MEAEGEGGGTTANMAAAMGLTIDPRTLTFSHFMDEQAKEPEAKDDTLLDLICPECHEETTSETDLIIHMQIHTNDKYFQCSHCEDTFIRAKSLAKHMLKHKPPENVFQCSVCQKKALRETGIKKHLEEHFEISLFKNPPYKCIPCKTPIFTKSLFQRHLKGHIRVIQNAEEHRRIVQEEEAKKIKEEMERKEEEPIKEIKDLDCPICYKPCEDTQGLKDHVIEHTEEKPFQCDICWEGLNDTCKLYPHMRIHLREVQLTTCPGCNKFFEKRSLLRLHLCEEHIKVPKGLSCLFTKENLKLETQATQTKVAVKCPICDSKQESRINLYYHLSSHRHRTTRSAKPHAEEPTEPEDPQAPEEPKTKKVKVDLVRVPCLLCPNLYRPRGLAYHVYAKHRTLNIHSLVKTAELGYNKLPEVAKPKEKLNLHNAEVTGPNDENHIPVDKGVPESMNVCVATDKEGEQIRPLDNNSLKCPLCTRICKSKLRLLEHFLNHDVFKSVRTKLLKSWDIARVVGKYSCPVCGCRFKNKMGIANHILEAHENPKAIIKNLKISDLYACPVCDQYKLCRGMRTHLNSHRKIPSRLLNKENVKLIQTDASGGFTMAYSAPTETDNHSDKYHPGKRIFQCPMCSVEFERRGAFIFHFLSHDMYNDMKNDLLLRWVFNKVKIDRDSVKQNKDKKAVKIDRESGKQNKDKWNSGKKIKDIESVELDEDTGAILLYACPHCYKGFTKPNLFKFHEKFTCSKKPGIIAKQNEEGTKRKHIDPLVNNDKQIDPLLNNDPENVDLDHPYFKKLRVPVLKTNPTKPPLVTHIKMPRTVTSIFPKGAFNQLKHCIPSDGRARINNAYVEIVHKNPYYRDEDDGFNYDIPGAMWKNNPSSSTSRIDPDDIKQEVDVQDIKVEEVTLDADQEAVDDDGGTVGKVKEDVYPLQKVEVTMGSDDESAALVTFCRAGLF